MLVPLAKLPWNNECKHMQTTSGENKHIKRGMPILPLPPTDPQSEFIENCSWSLAAPLPFFETSPTWKIMEKSTNIKVHQGNFG